MLAACRANAWPLEGYRLAEHPLQRRLLAELHGVVGEATDGCGVPTYAMTLRDAAPLLTRTQPRIAAAMQARPQLVGGRGAHDTELMRELPGWIAKRGAEGLFCAASADGLGIALKVEDGATRALPAALAAFLAPLGYALPGFERTVLRNSRDEAVGEISLRSSAAG
jgi:L-asparaginase II